MQWIKIICITIGFLSGGVALQAQSFQEANQFSELFVPAKKTKYKLAKDNKNEVQAIFQGLWVFYKVFISSQDGQTCSFHPSCSAYGLQSVKAYGPAKGLFNAFDRLARCNSLSPESYTFDPNLNLLLDPLE